MQFAKLTVDEFASVFEKRQPFVASEAASNQNDACKLWHRNRDKIAQIVLESPPIELRILDVSRAQGEARNLPNAIFELQSDLLNKLRKHETTIQKRWIKKNREHRGKILAEAWPEIPKYHRPVFKAYLRFMEQTHPANMRSLRDCFLYRHINSEHLTHHARPFLLLLNSSGRYPPGVFAQTDGRAHEMIRHVARTRDKLDDHTRLLTDQNTAELHGRIYSWEKHPEVLEWLTQNKGVLPVDGIAVMEIQKHNLDILQEQST